MASPTESTCVTPPTLPCSEVEARRCVRGGSRGSEDVVERYDVAVVRPSQNPAAAIRTNPHVCVRERDLKSALG